MTNLEAADLLDNLIGMVSDNHKGRDILKSEPCEDAISIEEAIHCLEQLVTDMPQLKLYAQKVADAMRDLHPVYPKPKTGRWITVNKGLKVTSYKCSECGRTVGDDTGYDVTKDYPYCHCGAKMEEVEE